LASNRGITDFSHLVGNIFGSPVHGFLWRNGNATQLSSLSGQMTSEVIGVLLLFAMS